MRQLNAVGRLNLTVNCYKNQKVHDKAVDYYTRALEFVPDCYNTQKMYSKAVDTYLSKKHCFWML